MENNTTEICSGKNVLQRMADLIARSEIALQHPLSPTHTQNYLTEKSKEFDKLFKNISADIQYCREIMTRAGAQQLRETTEKLSLESKKEIKTLENTYKKTKSTITSQCNQLNKASMSTVKNISQLISSVRQHQLKKFTEEKLTELHNNCEANTQKVQRMITLLQRKNLFTTVLITLLVATIVNLYIDDAWPWQAHQQFLNQREAGKILLDSWQQLSTNDKELIVQNA